ncbi:MAG: hypothetical protein DMF04_05010 [Verrucomicrobia bacterium]|jgi:hypothetical protein|nr:MAG: hypothetical protein DMF04_05010 [Verrucomicrobiota bacterium]
MKVLLLMPADLHLLVGIETMHISQTRFAISNHYCGNAGIRWQRNFFVPDCETTKAKPKVEYSCHNLLRAV